MKYHHETRTQQKTQGTAGQGKQFHGQYQHGQSFQEGCPLDTRQIDKSPRQSVPDHRKGRHPSNKGHLWKEASQNPGLKKRFHAIPKPFGRSVHRPILKRVHGPTVLATGLVVFRKPNPTFYR